eukprot:gene2117-2401_t
MSSENQNRSIHWFNTLALPLRVAAAEFNNEIQQRPASSLKKEEFIPDKSANMDLLQDVIPLITRVIVDNIKAFQIFCSLVVRHIPHKHTKEMAMKSVEITMFQLFVLAVQRKGKKWSKEFFLEDNLTEERSHNLQGAMADGDSDYESLNGLLPKNEDWHAIRYMYQILYEAFYNKESAKDIGSMTYNMNLVRNTNARGNVMDRFNECKKFVNFETDCLIIVLAMKYFGMRSLDGTKDEVIPPGVINGTKVKKIQWLHYHVKKMIEQYIVEPKFKEFLILDEDLEEDTDTNTFKCRFPNCEKIYRYNKVRENHEKKVHSLDFEECGVFQEGSANTHVDNTDDVYNYCTARLNLGLLLRNADDSVKEEQVNCLTKELLHNLGVNLNEVSAKRKEEEKEKILETAQNETFTKAPSGHHKKKTKETDLKHLVENLSSRKIFDNTIGRQYEKLRGFSRNLLAKLTVSSSSSWLTDLLKKFSKKYPS